MVKIIFSIIMELIIVPTSHESTAILIKMVTPAMKRHVV